MGKARPDRPKFIGLRRGDVKFFVDRDRFRNPERGRCFLYDLAADPHEMENLCDRTRRDEARRYREVLVEWYSKALEKRGGKKKAPDDAGSG
jgi:predicted Ser/Thr protein kinase